MKAAKIIKRVVGFLVIILIFLAECKAADFFLVDDAAEYPRYTFHEFYEQDDIQILLAGASHSYMSLKPEVITEAMGQKTFNASSARQAPDGTYTVIKEADALYNLEHVYVELSHTVTNITGSYKNRSAKLKYVYLISDYLKPSMNKLRYMLQSSSSKHYVNNFFKARRKAEQAFDMDYIKKVVSKKSDEAYKNYEYDYATRKTQWYAGLGYVANNTVFSEDGYYMTNVGYDSFDTEDISQDWRNSMMQIIEYCKENDIPLTLYSSPVSNFMLCSEGNYDEYIDYVKNFVEGTGIEYIDMNLVKPEYFEYLRDSYWDTDHFNIYGADRFTDFFIRYMKGEIPDEAFCDSVAERLDMEDPAYYGVAYKEKKKEWKMKLVANHPEMIEFKVEVVPDPPESENGEELAEEETVMEPILIQDFSSNREFSVSLKTVGNLVVTYRFKDHPEEEIVVTSRLPKVKN